MRSGVDGCGDVGLVEWILGGVVVWLFSVNEKFDGCVVIWCVGDMVGDVGRDNHVYLVRNLMIRTTEHGQRAGTCITHGKVLPLDLNTDPHAHDMKLMAYGTRESKCLTPPVRTQEAPSNKQTRSTPSQHANFRSPVNWESRGELCLNSRREQRCKKTRNAMFERLLRIRRRGFFPLL